MTAAMQSGGPEKDAGRFAGKVALVTGGSRGIGAAIARRLARGGARVAVGYRARQADAETVVAEIAREGGEAQAFGGDVSRPEDVARVVAGAVSAFGRLDIVVNNAGVSAYRPVGALDQAFFREQFEGNVLSAILVTQAALPSLPRPGGRIINLASRLAFDPIPGSAIYAAAKAAVITLTHAFARELGGQGITVNCVAPGLTETEMASGISKERREAVVAATPLGRLGIPEDIAGVVAFLASDEARWITGRTILADGGLT
ncbi:MAG: SDR family NAD(P)-dependent oxidoreductase [Hyphomicrobiales bacterium]